MGYPRCLHVPADSPGTYHCVSRCVRRAFLCGEDAVSGRSFDHRKDWLEQRILQLARVFAVAVQAYAVMSNHFHIVLDTDPGAPWQWSDEEVARRWLLLSSNIPDGGPALETRVAALAAQAQRLEVLRQRLGSLSWFMRYLKEPIARKANDEDGCTGRFWEGRFRTQALLDDQAVLACMVYVDLNPVRASVAATPEDSLHTSVHRRTHADSETTGTLRPLESSIDSQSLPLTTAQYLELVDWTGRALHPDKRGAIPSQAPPILARMALRPHQWLMQVPATESHYWRAIGSAESLVHRAKRAGLKWICGIGLARSLELAANTI